MVYLEVRPIGAGLLHRLVPIRRGEGAPTHDVLERDIMCSLGPACKGLQGPARGQSPGHVQVDRVVGVKSRM